LYWLPVLPVFVVKNNAVEYRANVKWCHFIWATYFALGVFCKNLAQPPHIKCRLYHSLEVTRFRGWELISVQTLCQEMGNWRR